MSDLDKAIRDRLARMVDETMERRNGLTSILPGTEMSRVIFAVQKLIDDHKPIGIYDECGHSHHPEEPGVKDVNDVGLVCAEGLTYEVCASCCEWNPVFGQTEHCASEHDHHWGGTHCMVVYSIAESLGVSGEDRSEPTTRAPRPGDTVRLWFENGDAIVGRLYLDPEDDDRERVEDKDGNGWLVEVNGVRRRMEAVDTPESS